MNIIKRIIKAEKEIKLKYFFKFMKNGFKYWKFRKTIQRIDKMVDKKVKIVFMWLLKQNFNSIKDEQRIDNFV
jgi:predicted transcriptional regulator with HTH domain